jgi:hypothetical protein
MCLWTSSFVLPTEALDMNKIGGATTSDGRDPYCQDVGPHGDYTIDKECTVTVPKKMRDGICCLWVR